MPTEHGEPYESNKIHRPCNSLAVVSKLSSLEGARQPGRLVHHSHPGYKTHVLSRACVDTHPEKKVG